MHELDVALRIADRIVVVNEQTIRVFNSPEEFVINGTLDELYGNGNRVVFSPSS